jgi:hypothetical protein
MVEFLVEERARGNSTRIGFLGPTPDHALRVFSSDQSLVAEPSPCR